MRREKNLGSDSDLLQRRDLPEKQDGRIVVFIHFFVAPACFYYVVPMKAYLLLLRVFLVIIMIIKLNKLGLSCVKLRPAWASFQLAIV